MWTPTIKEPTIKQKFVLFYFYFIAVVRAGLVTNTNLPLILHRFQVMAHCMSNFPLRQGVASPYRPGWGDPLRISP